MHSGLNILRPSSLTNTAGCTCHLSWCWVLGGPGVRLRQGDRSGPVLPGGLLAPFPGRVQAERDIAIPFRERSSRFLFGSQVLPRESYGACHRPAWKRGKGWTRAEHRREKALRCQARQRCVSPTRSGRFGASTVGAGAGAGVPRRGRDGCGRRVLPQLPQMAARDLSREGRQTAAATPTTPIHTPGRLLST